MELENRFQIAYKLCNNMFQLFGVAARRRQACTVVVAVTAMVVAAERAAMAAPAPPAAPPPVTAPPAATPPAANAEPTSVAPSDEVQPEPVSTGDEQIEVHGTPPAGAYFAIDKTQLERAESNDLHKVLSGTPGVYVRDEDGFGLRPNIGMRGAAAGRE